MSTTLRKQGNIYCVVSRNTTELSKIFVRLQEFYESPFKEIRGKYFTLKEFKTIYSKNKGGVFTYYVDWDGFNVPGHIVLEFFKIFTDLSPRERLLKKLLNKALTANIPFYLIGIPKRLNKRILNHEIAHAFFYLSAKYKKSMLAAGRNLNKSIKKEVFKTLRKMGYSGIVKLDELQAYMATTDISTLRYFFGKKVAVKHCRPFRRIFNKLNLSFRFLPHL